MSEDASPQQKRAMSAASRRMAAETKGEDFNFSEIATGFRELQGNFNSFRTEFADLKAKVSQLNLATQKNFNKFENLSCLKDGQCPPAQRTTAEIPTNIPVVTPDSLREIGHIADDGKVVIDPTALFDARREEPSMNPAADKPVCKASDDELKDEILDRRERRVRRQRQRARYELETGDDYGIGIELRAPAPRVAEVDMRSQLKAELRAELALRPKWYRNAFFKTTLGGIILFLLFIFWDDIVVFFSPEDEPPAVVAPAEPDLTAGQVRIVIDGREEQAQLVYDEWQEEVSKIWAAVAVRIIAARDRIDAVSATAGESRLYDAEVEYLEDAIQMLDEAAALSSVPAGATGE